MFSIATMQTKGGTSKSTTALNMAVAAVYMGFQVALIDTDVQRSIANWAQRRNQSAPAVFAMDATRLKNWLSSAGQNFDLCIIDTPANDWKPLTLAAVACDLSVIVSRATTFDLEAAIQVRNLLARAGLAHASLITQVAPQITRRLHYWLQTYAALGEMIDTPITTLVTYQDSAAIGLGVREYEPDGRAAREIDEVLQWILRRLKEKQ